MVSNVFSSGGRNLKGKTDIFSMCWQGVSSNLTWAELAIH